VDADWENSDYGLGQVVASHDGSKMLITWHCSTSYCGRVADEDSARPGERLYILDLTPLSRGARPQVSGIVSLPMSRGSIVRDISCDANDLCLASLSWDGVVAIDIGEGANRFRIIAQHSETFRGEEVPEAAAFARMTSGAQKVYTSSSSPGTFYVEKWSLDMPCLRAGKTLSDCVRYDSVWSIALFYVRPSLKEMVVLPMEPAQGMLYLLGRTFNQILKALPKHTSEHLMEVTSVALQDALRVTAERVLVYSASPVEKDAADEAAGKVGALIRFKILPAAQGATPMQLMNILAQQIKTPGSSFHTGPLRDFADNVLLEIQDDTADNSGPGGDGNTVSATNDEPERSGKLIAVLAVALIFVVLVALLALLYASIQRRAMRRAKEQAAREGNSAVGDGGLGQADANGFIIGRPSADAPGGGGGGAGGSAYVVGQPVADGGASAAAGTVSGAALSDTDKNKMAMPEPTSTAQASDAAAAAEAAAPTAVALEIAGSAGESGPAGGADISPRRQVPSEALSPAAAALAEATSAGGDDSRLRSL